MVFDNKIWNENVQEGYIELYHLIVVVLKGIAFDYDRHIED